MQTLHKSYCSFILIAFTLGWFSSSAQYFKRIEFQANLEEVKNNNGIAIADYDNDRDLDIFIVARQQPDMPGDNWPSVLYRNNNDGTFTNVTEESGIGSFHDYTGIRFAVDAGFKQGASWGDYDNDGYADLFLTSTYHLELYHNNGDGTFTDVTESAGFQPTNECFNSGVTWFDYNNDGHLDVYITKWGECFSNFLFENNQDGTFTDVTEEKSVTGNFPFSYMSFPIDINNDGWQDIYVSNDFKADNELYINNAGTDFEQQSRPFGLSDPKDGMGVAVSDHNNDGSFEIYITNINDNSFYELSSETSYVNLAPEFGIEDAGWAWGTQFGDFDHDGDEDLVVANGHNLEEKNFYYQNQHIEGGTGFIDKSEESNIGTSFSSSNGLSVFDYDNDGDLDILIGNTVKPLFFYENEHTGGNSDENSNWLKVELRGAESNRNGFGSQVEIETTKGKMYRLYTGANFLSQNVIPIHFGLSDIDNIDKLKIKWPSGVVDTYQDIPVNKNILLTEGTGYEILPNNPATKISGCTDPSSCSYNPDATLDDGSCTYLESKTISGNDQSNILRTETYSYSGADGSSYQWTVRNGKIESGQGSSSIQVKWNIHQEGTVSVTEINDCTGMPGTMNVSLSADEAASNHSIARLWNEALLEAIRNDYARPTVHARNLFHTSVAMYDAWAIHDQQAQTYLIGNQINNFNSVFDGFETTVEKDEALKQTISYAAYRLLSHRFEDSPNSESTLDSFSDLMTLLSYDVGYTSIDYSEGDPRALGNFIAESLIFYGQIDGAREGQKYENAYYKTVNPPLIPGLSGNTKIKDPNRWQPLQLEVYIDQAGNPVDASTPDFLSPEWGNVAPFSLHESSSTSVERDGDTYKVYHDPGSPPKLDIESTEAFNELYQWNFSLVSIWSAHLNPDDGVMWDISPAGIGNINFEDFPSKLEEHDNFYELTNGGDIGSGRSINPITNEAYEPQMVPRGDYARVLAEFWADGPDSETPPGHWFVLLNHVSDHPMLAKKFEGKGDVLDDLEWDVKSYFMLGGAMHDAAISAWSIKGWYDYIRPISAIRYMADLGQSTDPSLDNYHAAGIPLVEGYIETVRENDKLAGENGEHVGKIKLYAWKGHDYIKDTQTDQASVDWILAENWWPYQRPSFVTPPFAGYVSGHSTFSRTAAEVLTLLTGSEYFPGGMGEFVAKKNEFLVFEEGPSQDVILQWATYRDASDQCSLSRIWGGIHPPADDIPGRIIGEQVGKDAYEFAKKYFSRKILSLPEQESRILAYPNPLNNDGTLYIRGSQQHQQFRFYDLQGREVPVVNSSYNPESKITKLYFVKLKSGIYILSSGRENLKIIVR